MNNTSKCNPGQLLPNQGISVPKNVLAEMSVAEFSGEIVVVDNVSDISKAIDYLSLQEVIGFDTETKPTFHRGSSNKVSLIQLSTMDRCYLFRIKKTGLHQSIIELLSNPNVLKIGLSLHDDFLNLSKLSDFKPAGFIDLQSYVKQFNIEDNSLQRIYAIIFGCRITKGQRLTNWEAQELSSAQMHYAALDAYACLRIYSYLSKDKFNPACSPYIITHEEDTHNTIE